MSYDIRLFQPRPGEDPLVTARREAGADTEASPPDPAREALKERIAAALQAANPRLERFAFDYAAIARSRGISEEAARPSGRPSVPRARRDARHIELNGPEDSNGIQIEIHDDEAYVTVPYWHDGAAAEAAFDEIWGYARIIQRETGYAAYDPQLDALLDLREGTAAALRVYANTRALGTPERPEGRAAVFGQSPVAAPRRARWWEFWKNRSGGNTP